MDLRDEIRKSYYDGMMTKQVMNRLMRRAYYNPEQVQEALESIRSNHVGMIAWWGVVVMILVVTYSFNVWYKQVLFTEYRIPSILISMDHFLGMLGCIGWVMVFFG